VIDLVVEAHGQPEGVGRLLFEALRKWFQEQGIQEIVAHVPHRQVVDQAFWRALGATEWVDLMWLTL
jgi:GNAT superfamily N-acetyltransferase